jgi:hypothetical protein
MANIEAILNLRQYNLGGKIGFIWLEYQQYPAADAWVE